MPHGNRRPDAILQIKWRTLALGACLVAVALLASAVVLINTSGDALASVALVLAILAFVIQIITFIVDSFSNAQRDRESQRIYAKTRALLARIDEKGRQTNDTVREQYDKLLDRLLVNIKTSVGTEDGSAEDIPQNARLELLTEVRQAIDDARNVGTNSSIVRHRRRAGRDGANFDRWPQEHTINALVRDGVNELSARERSVLAEFAADWRISSEADIPEGLPSSAVSSEDATLSLAEQGFLRFDNSSGFYKLSGKGKAAARLFTTSSAAVPTYVERNIPWIREFRDAQSE